jgi:DNA invertase Pin-like site-specific DNA recombinase
MAATLVGYCRCSTDAQDLTAQRQRLRELGVTEDRIYLDHGLTGTNRARPGLDQALAALRDGDTLVVPKLDRLARSVPDASDIGDGLAARGIKLSLGGQVYDPTDPMGKMFFNILATFAEFEVDLLRMRTREGMAVARAKGRLKGPATEAVDQAADRVAPHARHRGLHHQRPRRALQYLPTNRLPHPRGSGKRSSATRSTPMTLSPHFAHEGQFQGSPGSYFAAWVSFGRLGPTTVSLVIMESSEVDHVAD